jgi:hypothetical protein
LSWAPKIEKAAGSMSDGPGLKITTNEKVIAPPRWPQICIEMDGSVCSLLNIGGGSSRRALFVDLVQLLFQARDLLREQFEAFLILCSAHQLPIQHDLHFEFDTLVFMSQWRRLREDDGWSAKRFRFTAAA